MKTVLIVLLCLAVFAAVLGYQKVAEGYYFSGEALIRHAVEDFPPAPSVNWSSDDFLNIALRLIQWCGDFFGWLTGFDPWEHGTPSYRGNSFPWGVMVA